MYRLLEQHGELRERRDELVHPPIRSRNCWPLRPTRCGVGTSPSCAARSNGPTSIFT
jgi:hypothetical protein